MAAVVGVVYHSLPLKLVSLLLLFNHTKKIVFLVVFLPFSLIFHCSMSLSAYCHIVISIVTQESFEGLDHCMLLFEFSVPFAWLKFSINNQYMHWALKYHCIWNSPLEAICNVGKSFLFYIAMEFSGKRKLDQYEYTKNGFRPWVGVVAVAVVALVETFFYEFFPRIDDIIVHSESMNRFNAMK